MTHDDERAKGDLLNLTAADISGAVDTTSPQTVSGFKKFTSPVKFPAFRRNELPNPATYIDCDIVVINTRRGRVRATSTGTNWVFTGTDLIIN